MGQIDDLKAEFMRVACDGPDYFGDYRVVPLDVINDILLKHLEPQKKAEVCKHINWNLRPAPFCNDCEQYLLEKTEPQQEEKKIELLPDLDKDKNEPIIIMLWNKVNELILSHNK